VAVNNGGGERGKQGRKKAMDGDSADLSKQK